MDDIVFIYENFLEKSICQPYIDRMAEKWAKYKHDKNSFLGYNRDMRVIDITDDPMVQKVKKFLEETLCAYLEIEQALIQVWPQNYHCRAHKHDISTGRENTDFNSLIYLNDNYGGGEFYTEKGVCYKPTAGSLTFFNGAVNMHGSKTVIGHDRFTLIFLWKKPTIFKL